MKLRPSLAAAAVALLAGAIAEPGRAKAEGSESAIEDSLLVAGICEQVAEARRIAPPALRKGREARRGAIRELRRACRSARSGDVPVAVSTAGRALRLLARAERFGARSGGVYDRLVAVVLEGVSELLADARARRGPRGWRIRMAQRRFDKAFFELAHERGERAFRDLATAVRCVMRRPGRGGGDHDRISPGRPL